MTFLLRNPKDGRLHWSDLKHMAECPAMARHALENPKAVTPAMRFGSAVDAALFGTRKLVFFDGRKDGKKWDAFVSTCTFPIDEVLSVAEYDSALRAADAVNADPVAKPLLIGRHQVVAQWEAHGLPFAAGIEGERGGFDILGSEWIADLKVTTSTRPHQWGQQAWRMLYPVQLALYADSARALGHYPNKAHLIGVRAKAPHIVTVLTMSEATLDVARRMIASWCEQVLECERSGHWPGYVQSASTLDPQSFDFTDTEDD